MLERDTEVYTLPTARLSRANVPADPMATKDHVRSVVVAYDDASRFDLEPVCSELNALRETTVEFMDDADNYTPELDKIVKTLTRLNFTTDGQFEQDPAQGRPPFPRLEATELLPELDGDNERFLEIQLQRARNEVISEIRQLRKPL